MGAQGWPNRRASRKVGRGGPERNVGALVGAAMGRTIGAALGTLVVIAGVLAAVLWRNQKDLRELELPDPPGDP